MTKSEITPTQTIQFPLRFSPKNTMSKSLKALITISGALCLMLIPLERRFIALCSFGEGVLQGFR